MKKKSIITRLSTGLLALSILLSGCAQAQEAGSAEALNAEVKGASEQTKAANEAVYDKLNFDDESELDNAKRGLLRKPDSLEVKNADGDLVWSQDVYEFVRDQNAPATANPSLWRNTQQNAEYGLFEVSDGIYQVRGYDLANITFIRGDKGWIVFDCGTSVETAAAALALFKEEFKDARISAVVISHAHVDHYGGIAGLIEREQLADPEQSLKEQLASGKTLLIVPVGFEKAAMEENVLAGAVMKRRSAYQYGSLLGKGETAGLSVGIGQTVCNGTSSYYPPTYEVKEPTEEITVDGVKMVFQLTPGTESPAEMNTYLPQYKALWMAENCTASMHNIYTLRGAEVRDAGAWGSYILEARALFGDEAEVVFQSHNWPHWGKDVVDDYLLNTAAVYRFIHSQTLQYLNQGLTSTEIAETITLPEELEKVWYTRQYYGTLSHNAKAVYQKYMGWYDANPVHLNQLSPQAYGTKLVEYLGGADKALEKARQDFAAGEYQWVAELTSSLVFADPENQEARWLCADALEQLGYQAESGAWRNACLTGAYELRHGTDDYPKISVGGTGAASQEMSTEMMLDYLAMCLDTDQCPDQNLTINLEVTDENEQYLLELRHGVLLYVKDKVSDDPDATIKLKRLGILALARGNEEGLKKTVESVEGKEDVLAVFTDHLAAFDPLFNIIEP